jgi:drug/metabolite transporter (DMT)-like permease
LAAVQAKENLPKKASEYFQKRPLVAVFATATLNAIGCILMGLVSRSIHPMQSTFLVYLLDLAWTLVFFMPLFGSYKTASGRISEVYGRTYDVWKGLKGVHKLYLAAFSLITVAASSTFYFVLPHVTPAMMLVFMQISLITTLPLSYVWLGEKTGWRR